MRIMRLGPLFALSALFLIAPIQAQQSLATAPAPRDAQAVAVLQRSLAALVGTNTIKDVTLTGNVMRIAGSDNESGTATLKATSIGQARIDLSLSGGQRSEVADISQAAPTGSWSGPDGTWHSDAGHNLFTDPTWFFPAFLINRVLSTITYVVSPLDAETKDGIAVEHLSVYKQVTQGDSSLTLTENLSRMDIYLDASRLLPVAVTFSIHPDRDAFVNIPTEVRFSNYQSVQGASVPYRIQECIQNGLALDLTATSIQFNSGLSPTDFQAQ